MSIRQIRITEIVTDAGTQIRASINDATVAEYADAMRDGSEFPSVTLFHDGNRYILADGFHRVMATARIGGEFIKSDVRNGTKADALKFALAANCSHGLRRTNSDKRRSVELAVSEWPRLSDRSIAKLCAVSRELVGDVRRQLSENDSSGAPQTRVGSDGRERRLPRRRQESSSGYSPADDAATSPAPSSVAEPRFDWAASASATRPVLSLVSTQSLPDPDRLTSLMESLRELTESAAAELGEEGRNRFADELEAAALDLRNQ